jgi:hypothetical protein
MLNMKKKLTSPEYHERDLAMISGLDSECILWGWIAFQGEA